MGNLLAFARGAVGFLHGEIVAMVVGGPCGKCVGPSVGFLHGVLFAREPCWVSVGLVRPAAQARCPAAQASSSGQMPSSSGQREEKREKDEKIRKKEKKRRNK